MIMMISGRGGGNDSESDSSWCGDGVGGLGGTVDKAVVPGMDGIVWNND